LKLAAYLLAPHRVAAGQDGSTIATMLERYFGDASNAEMMAVLAQEVVLRGKLSGGDDTD
jgi:heme oxygenase